MFNTHIKGFKFQIHRGIGALIGNDYRRVQFTASREFNIIHKVRT